jgi:hypothetical protein
MRFYQMAPGQMIMEQIAYIMGISPDENGPLPGSFVSDDA